MVTLLSFVVFAFGISLVFWLVGAVIDAVFHPIRTVKSILGAIGLILAIMFLFF